MAVNRLTFCRLLSVIVVFCILSQFFAPSHYVALLRGGVATAIARNEGSKSDKNRERRRNSQGFTAEYATPIDLSVFS